MTSTDGQLAIKVGDLSRTISGTLRYPPVSEKKNTNYTELQGVSSEYRHSFFSPPGKVGTTKVGTRLKCGTKVGTSGKILGIWRDIVPFSPKQAGQGRSGQGQDLK